MLLPNVFCLGHKYMGPAPFCRGFCVIRWLPKRGWRNFLRRIPGASSHPPHKKEIFLPSHPPKKNIFFCVPQKRIPFTHNPLKNEKNFTPSLHTYSKINLFFSPHPFPHTPRKKKIGNGIVFTPPQSKGISFVLAPHPTEFFLVSSPPSPPQKINAILPTPLLPPPRHI